MRGDTPPDLSLEEAAQAFAALGSEQRLAVLRTLVRAGPAGLSAGDLAHRTGVANSTLTHHLRFLVAAGLVDQTRRGRTVMCSSVAYDRVAQLSAFVLTQCCADASVAAHTPSEETAHDHG
ncbi:MAG: metalloregulator ArsR/SmtB family transcription factor [Pseudomonadota bacterium]